MVLRCLVLFWDDRLWRGVFGMCRRGVGCYFRVWDGIVFRKLLYE